MRILTESLEGDDLEVRCWAAGYLGEIGPKAGSTAPALLEVLGEKKWPLNSLFIRVPAAAAHWRVTGRVEAALPVLIEGLAAEPKYVACQAAEALGEMGAKAKSARPAPLKAAERGDAVLARYARAAIAKIAN